MPAAPPKPWEARASGSMTASTPSLSTTTGGASTPTLPPKPPAMSSDTTTTSTSTAVTQSSLYNRPLSTGLSSYSSYSPYSRFGSTYGGYSGYGGYGGYGGGYGYGGYGGYGGFNNSFSPYGAYPPGEPNPNQPSLMQQMEASTLSTFQLLQSIVQTFGGFSQMLESTFMATHSSFFAMIGLADQFTRFRSYLGEVLSLFAIWRWAKDWVRWMRGTRSLGRIGVEEFKNFDATGQLPKLKRSASNTSASRRGQTAKPSKKPLVIFFLTVFGIPYLMSKLIKLIARKQEEERLRMIAAGGDPNMITAPPHLIGADGQPVPMYLNNAASTPSSQVLDPSTLLFVRALHPHRPSKENETMELSFDTGEIIAVLTPENERSKMLGETGGEGGWWKGRTRDGRIGWFPSNFAEEVKRKDAEGN